MSFSTPVLSLSITILLFSTHIGASQVFQQQGPVPQVIELYTSEGCSSCPPADRYLRTLLDDPQLWKTRIPVAFHVDYWDYIGWKDRFAQERFSQRQRTLQFTGAVSSVYTPGWVVDGKEWRGFFYRQSLPDRSGRSGGLLTLKLDNNLASLQYAPTKQHTHPLRAHLVVMTFDQYSQVKAGENRGKILRHAFIAQSLQQAEGTTRWQFRLDSFNRQQGRHAIAAWVTEGSTATPLQALGGWLK